MYGSCWRLPAIALLLLPAVLSGQSGRPQPSQEPARQPREFEPAPAPDIPSAPQPPHSPTSPPGTFGLPQLAQSAGIIFSGRVTAIAHPAPSAGHAVETVAITFHVDQAIRGPARGSEVTISQWMGVWSGGQRYRVGERLLLFLYPPSKLGLTSCVGGPMGRFALDPWGRVLLSAQQRSLLPSGFPADPVLGGESRVRFDDFVRAVRHARGEE
jgi:hypothetical protein